MNPIKRTEEILVFGGALVLTPGVFTNTKKTNGLNLGQL
jgi:hypothetical protein